MMIGKGFVFVCLLGSSAASMALTAYSNLASDTGFNSTSGVVIGGSKTSTMVGLAMRFTSAETGVLQNIAFPVTVKEGTNRLLFGLYSANADGKIGSVISSWMMSSLPTGDDCYTLTTIEFDPASPINIVKGTSYWVSMMADESSGGSDTEATWCFSSTEGDAYYAATYDNGLTYGYVNTADYPSSGLGQAGLRVELGESSVPGPAAAIVFGAGLAALRRRRK